MAVILVVDDDAETRALLHAVLAGQLGHEVVFAQDGEVAVDRFHRHDPDLVITDLVMPRMHGVVLIERLAQIYPSAPIIAISGKAPEQLYRARDAGAVATLQKPLEKAQLVPRWSAP